MNVPGNVILGCYYNTEIDSYQVEIIDIPTFNGGNEILYSGIVDTLVNANLTKDGTFYRRVLAQNAVGSSAWSETWIFTTYLSLDIDDGLFALPKAFVLKQNYPNPFNPTTTIVYELPKTENVKIEIFNLLGQKMKTLLNQPMSAGSHKVEFSAENFSSGVYLYRIEAGEFILIDALF